MQKTIQNMARKMLGTDRAHAIETAIDKMRIGDKIVITRSEGTSLRLALIRNGRTVHTETGSFRDVFESAMKFLDPETLDGVRKVRLEPNGAKVN